MRRALIAKIKIAQKELGLDDDTYRAVLERVTGKRSCADMDVSELEYVSLICGRTDLSLKQKVIRMANRIFVGHHRQQCWTKSKPC